MKHNIKILVPKSPRFVTHSDKTKSTVVREIFYNSVNIGIVWEHVLYDNTTQYVGWWRFGATAQAPHTMNRVVSSLSLTSCVAKASAQIRGEIERVTALLGVAHVE